MFRRWQCCAFLSVATLWVADDVAAHSVFMKALKADYGFQSVSCSTCHSKKEEIADEDMEKYREHPKAFRNDFGKLFEPYLEGKNVGREMQQARELKKDDMDDLADEIEAAVASDFFDALRQVEPMKDQLGNTYRALLKARMLDGVR